MILLVIVAMAEGMILPAIRKVIWSKDMYREKCVICIERCVQIVEVIMPSVYIIVDKDKQA